jgi:hypothetical protein
LDREAFHSLLGRLDSLRSMWRFEALQRVPLFARLDHKTKAAVAAALGQVHMPKGTAVVTQVRLGCLSWLVACCFDVVCGCGGSAGPGAHAQGHCGGDAGAASVLVSCSTAWFAASNLGSSQVNVLMMCVGVAAALARCTCPSSCTKHWRMTYALHSRHGALACSTVNSPCFVCVCVQGERGHAFHIVESGQLSAFKDNQPLPVMSYGPGAPAATAVWFCPCCF